MNKTNLLKRKGYYGSIHFNAKDELFYRKVEFTKDLLLHEASDTRTLIHSGKQLENIYRIARN